IMTGTSSNNGYGVDAESADTSGTYSALYAQGDNTATYIFRGKNTATGAQCTINANAHLDCPVVTGNEVRVRRTNATGQHVLTYCAESASATLEDVGTARMAGGIATVAIDRAFGMTIDRSAYHVFVTPEGDASLYIAQKSPTGFVVRETHGGRSTLDFEYR